MPAQGRAKLQELSHLKEAEQLLRSMLTFKPKGRPSMRAVMSHPFWWPPAQRPVLPHRHVGPHGE